ncbi:MAG: hypothetical protein V8T46_03905 [Sutterella seckii]
MRMPGETGMAISIVRIVLTLIPAFYNHVGSQIQHEAGTVAEVLGQEFVEPVVIHDFLNRNERAGHQRTAALSCRTTSGNGVSGKYSKNFSLGNIIPSSSETLPIIARTGTVCFFAGSYLTTDDVENVRTALGLLTTDFADGSRSRDVYEEHLLTSFEGLVMLSIVQKKRTKRKSFSWLFQAIVAVFKLPLGRE